MTPREQMAANIGAILDNKINDEGAVRILLETEDLKLTAAQIAGGVDAVMARAVTFPEFPAAMDVCGTGGDYQHTYNISTATAFVVAACGVKVAKHGNRAITSQSGSADVLEKLGVVTSLSAKNCEAILNEIGICFLFAPVFHPSFRSIAPLRKAIGQRTIFNLLGPLCNPAKVDRQLIGVYNPALLKPVADACKLLGRKHVMVVHGNDGADELSITGETQVCEMRGGELNQYTMAPSRAGLPTHPMKAIKGGDAEENAEAMLEIFNGTENAYADAVVLNAAAALIVAGKAQAFRGAASMARDALVTGGAKAVLNQLIVASQKAQ